VIDTVASEFLPSLADKEPVLVKRLWSCTVLTDIELEEMRGFFLKGDEPEAISLSQDGQCFFMRVEVVQVQCGDLSGPGPRVIKEVKKRIVPEALFSPEVNGLKDIEDFLLIQKAYQGFLKTLLRNVNDPLRQFSVIRVHQADHFGKGFECVETDITGFGTVLSSLFKILQECDDELR